MGLEGDRVVTAVNLKWRNASQERLESIYCQMLGETDIAPLILSEATQTFIQRIFKAKH